MVTFNHSAFLAFLLLQLTYSDQLTVTNSTSAATYDLRRNNEQHAVGRPFPANISKLCLKSQERMWSRVEGILNVPIEGQSLAQIPFVVAGTWAFSC